MDEEASVEALVLAGVRAKLMSVLVHEVARVMAVLKSSVKAY